MLDYILTRHEDKDLFPDRHDGPLEYLVLDEIHTYTGHQGADVAALVRRLREHTGADDDLTCIGTSATVQSEAGIEADEEISEFSARIFGSPVDSERVIEESYYPIEFSGSEQLPDTITVTATDIEEFDGTLEKAAELTAQLTDRPLVDTETASADALGDVLRDHPTVAFLDEHLNTESLQIQQTTDDADSDTQPLVDRYRATHRPDATEADARRELQAALLVGTIATTAVQGEQQPIFIPKLHSFFSQGSGLVACIT